MWVYSRRRFKGIHFQLIEGLEGANIDLQLHAAQRVWSGNPAGSSPIIEILLDECGMSSRKWMRGAAGNGNSTSGNLSWYCYVRLNCLDTSSGDATDSTALYTKLRTSRCNFSLEKCETFQAQWLRHIPPGLT